MNFHAKFGAHSLKIGQVMAILISIIMFIIIIIIIFIITIILIINIIFVNIFREILSNLTTMQNLKLLALKLTEL